MNFSKSITPMNHFERLPEDCIFEIISKTTPADAVRSTILSKGFKSAAESDEIWRRFLPSDYQEISDSSELPPVCNTKKELFFSLCDSPILIDGGTLSFFLDKHSGKKCFMIAPRELIISGRDNAYLLCQWKKHPNSRFSEVACFGGFRWFDIRGNISRQKLSKRTTYAAYLVFKIARDAIDSLVIGSFVNREAEERREVGLLNAQRRADGWMEIVIGKFFNDAGEDGDVEAGLMRYFGIGRLLVQGIEFRPE